MRRENETWEAWAARNGTNRAALEARCKAFAEAGDDEDALETLRGTDPEDFCFRHLIGCPVCGMTHMESNRVPFLRCACGFRARINRIEVTASGFELVDVTAEYDWQYGEK
jgi:hypothetical protein